METRLLYSPPQFREDSIEAQHAVIRALPFATLVSNGADGVPEVTHLPLRLVDDPAPRGRLIGHVARANPHWRCLLAAPAAVAIFHGPSSYISPNWYATKRETGKVVPTWNYVVVHAQGRVRVFEDAAALHGVVAALTEEHERAEPAPWKVDDAPAGFVRGQLKGIVGLELVIDELNGKWKVSQNRPAHDRAGVIEALEVRARSADQAIARIMREREPG